MTSENSPSRIKSESDGIFPRPPWRGSLSMLSIAFVGAGVLLAVVNSSWPVTRNALDYAKSAHELIASHFNVYSVVHNPKWTGGKPVLFSIVASAFAWFLTSNAAVIIASAIGTVFFLYTVALALPRIRNRCDTGPGHCTLAFFFTAFNPLVMYQFWSGYPDSLFAGFVLLAFVLVDSIATEPERNTGRRLAGLVCIISAAIYTKLYGAVLLFMCPLYFIALGSQGTAGGGRFRWAFVWLCTALSVPAAVAVSAALGINPFLILDPQSGVTDFPATYESAIENAKNSVVFIAFATVLSFQFAILFLSSRNAWRVRGAAAVVFGVIYVCGLVPHFGMSFNMRFLLPIYPIIASMLAMGAHSFSATVRNSIIAIYATVAVISTASFNVAWVEARVQPLIDALTEREPLLSLWLDNLRLPTQIAIKKQIDAINTAVPDGSVLYWSSDYYDRATHDLAHDLGVKKELKVR